MKDTDHQMNQAERLDHFLANTNEGTEIDKSFLPLVRRIWRRKDGMKLFAMVDDSFILWVNDLTKTFATAEDVAETLIRPSNNSNTAKVKAATVAYLRAGPRADDIQYEDSPIEVVIAQLAKATFNG